jgi:hypothetical protein
MLVSEQKLRETVTLMFVLRGQSWREATNEYGRNFDSCAVDACRHTGIPVTMAMLLSCAAEDETGRLIAWADGRLDGFLND